MKITLKQLKKLGACADQTKLFKEIFGDSVEITEDVIREHGAKFDVNWLAGHVLSPTHLAAYQAKLAPLWADYQAKCAPLDDEYKAKCAPLLADYQAKCAPLWAGYLAKRDLLWADYEAKRALLFWEVVK